MAKKPKTGSVTLLKEKHFKQDNPFGQPVVGWQPTLQGVGGLFNPRGYAILRVVIHKLIDRVMKPLYDQPMIVENAGSVIIAKTEDGRIGLIESFRMIGDRLLPNAGANYIHQLQKEHLWEKLLGSLGQWSWEAPKGLIPPTDQDFNDIDLNDFILKSAVMETLDEAGLNLKNAKIVGRVNVNTTFFAHAQYVVFAEIESVGKANPEDLEIIGKVKFFSLDQLKSMNQEGAFVDGLTLAAFTLCGISL